MESKRKIAGFTLAEVLVYCSLLSIFSAIFFLSLPGRSFQGSEDIQQASQSANFALIALSNRVSNAAAGQIQTTSKPPGLIFLSAQAKSGSAFQYTKDGQLGWLQWEGVFQEDDQLVSYTQSFKEPLSLADVGPAPSWSELAKNKKKILVKNVRAFKYDANKFGSWIFLLEVQAGSSWQQIRTGAKARN